jgi:hypothetical protein
LEGLKFTLPRGEYKVEASPLITEERLIPVLQSIGFIAADAPLDMVKPQISPLFAGIARAEITKVFPHLADHTKVDIYVKVQAPVLVPLKVVVRQL